MKWKITVKTVRNEILKFTNIDSYQIEKGFVIFTDSKTDKVKRFHGSNCEIEEWEVRQ